MTTPTTSSSPLQLDATRQDHDLFTDQELARLRFVRWLYQTGRLPAETGYPSHTHDVTERGDSMTGYPDSPQTEGADVMTGPATHHSFGQEINPHQLSVLAQQIAAAIGAGSPASWAGFVWSGPQHARDERQPATRRAEEDGRPARAA